MKCHTSSWDHISTCSLEATVMLLHVGVSAKARLQRCYIHVQDLIWMAEHPITMMSAKTHLCSLLMIKTMFSGKEEQRWIFLRQNVFGSRLMVNITGFTVTQWISSELVFFVVVPIYNWCMSQSENNFVKMNMGQQSLALAKSEKD